MNEDILDYKKILSILNISEDIADEKLKNPRLYKEIHLSNTEVRNSDIEGLGLFAIIFIMKGSVIEPAIVEKYYTTQAGKYINHSVSTNSYIRDDYYLIAEKDINIGEEITIDYRHVFEMCQNVIIKE